MEIIGEWSDKNHSGAQYPLSLIDDCDVKRDNILD